MNYYERHIGDYLKDTAHLSLLEHGVYTRLLDVYYTREGGIPAAEAARLIGARSKEERAALSAVLTEFFELRDGAHVQGRADREIERFRAKSDKARSSINARWEREREHKTNYEGDTFVQPTNNDRNTNVQPTNNEGNTPRARPQSPVTSNQKTKEGSAHDAVGPFARAREGPEPNGHDPTAAGAACRAMRDAGLAETNPGDPRLLALLAQGASVAELSGIAAEAAGKGKGWAWVLKVVESRRADAAAIALAPRADGNAKANASLAESAAYIAEQAAIAAAARTPEAAAFRRAAMARVGRVS